MRECKTVPNIRADDDLALPASLAEDIELAHSVV
jgi:hypothetical protein